MQATEGLDGFAKVSGELDRLDGKEVLMGVLEGFGASVPDLEECIKTDVDLTYSFVSAVHLLTSHNATRVKEGLVVLSKALKKDAIPALTDCKNAKHDIIKIQEALIELENPHTLVIEVGRWVGRTRGSSS
jgi:hypothetical protein